MRLTVFLIGTAALIGGIFVSAHQVVGSTTDAHGVYGRTYCGTTFAPMDSVPLLPRRAEDCYGTIVPWQVGGAILFLAGGFLLIRLLYMLIGPRIPIPAPASEQSHVTSQARSMTQTPAAWYLTLERPGQIRWWDGSQWTEHVQNVPSVAWR